jgi:hypothetical protein
MNSKGLLLVAALLLLAAPASAMEITFQVTEVDLGQDVATTVGIGGSEWLTFGFDMVGGSLLLYGPPNEDPFLPATDNNGVFEVGADSFEIVFNDPITDLEVDLWSVAPADSTLTAFSPSGAAIQVETNLGTSQDTELFGGIIKRLVIESDPGTVCIANLRFNDAPQFPSDSRWSLGLSFLMLVAGLAAVLVWRSR